jgi:hypothetical protein
VNPVGLLLRMKRLAQHPPSWGRVLLGLAVIAAVLAVAGAEALGLWPDSWTASRARPPVISP